MVRSVPWTSWTEWEQVRQWLLSAEEHERRLGLARVSAWRARGRVPHAIDVTASLVELALADPASAGSGAGGGGGGSQTLPALYPPVPSDHMLQVQYAMVLTRLVNGITDSQQRGRVASSVGVLASYAGLPRILVDIRHEATHNELPSLALLRLGARQALAWLGVNYWRRQAEQLAAVREGLAGALSQLLDSWAAAVGKQINASGRGGGSQLNAAAATEDDDDDDNDDDDHDGDGGNGGGRRSGAGAAAYGSAEGQRRRKELLSDIKSEVPTACTAVLVAAVLDSSVMDPPGSGGGSGGEAAAGGRGGSTPVAAAAGSAMAAALSSGGGGGGAAMDARVRAQAWSSCMKQLTKHYTALPSLLLHGVVSRLCDTAAAEAAAAPRDTPLAGGSAPAAAANGDASGKRIATLMAWAAALLSHAQTRGAGGGGGGKGSGSSKGRTGAVAAMGSASNGSGLLDAFQDVRPSPAQLKQLLAQVLLQQQPVSVLRTSAAVAAAAAAGAGGGGGAAAAAVATPAGAQHEAACASAALRQLSTMLSAALGSSCWLPREARLLCRLAEVVSPTGAGAGGARAQISANGGSAAAAAAAPAAAAAAAAGGDEEQLQQQLATAVQQQQALMQVAATGRKRKREDDDATAAAAPSAAAGSSAPRSSKWSRVAEWQSCAIGCLPSVHDPNGCCPPLDMRQDDQQQPGQQVATMTAATQQQQQLLQTSSEAAGLAAAASLSPGATAFGVSNDYDDAEAMPCYGYTVHGPVELLEESRFLAAAACTAAGSSESSLLRIGQGRYGLGELQQMRSAVARLLLTR